MASSTAPMTNTHTGHGAQNINTESGVQINGGIFHGALTFFQRPHPGPDHPAREQLKTSFLQALQQHGLPDYAARKDINRRATEGTCLWFKDHPHFKTWLHSPGSSLLWVSADPGCGKSVLAKHLIDFSVLKKPDDQGTTVSYFFFKDTFDQHDVARALCCILFQIIHQRPDLIPEKHLRGFEINGRLLTPSFETVWPIFKDVVYEKDAGQIICVFDGVDECKEKQLPQLVDKLREIYGSETGSANLKVIFLSRPYDRIHSQLIGHIPVIHLSGETEAEMRQISKEIDLVITARVKELVRRKFLPNSPDGRKAEDLLLRKMLGVAHRTYLWAHLTLEVIEGTELDECKNLGRQIDKITSKLPESVYDAYERILSNVKRPREARTLLQLVIAAIRPLSLQEIYTALQITLKLDAADLRVAPRPDPDEPRLAENEIQQYVRECCGLFVVIVGKNVYLLHQTAKEFLLGNPTLWQAFGLSKATWKSSIDYRECHLLLSWVCIHYLDSLFSVGAESLSVESEAKLRESPSPGVKWSPIFREYAAGYWVHHIILAPVMFQRPVLEHVFGLCDAESEHFGKWVEVYWAWNCWSSDYQGLEIAWITHNPHNHIFPIPHVVLRPNEYKQPIEGSRDVYQEVTALQRCLFGTTR